VSRNIINEYIGYVETIKNYRNTKAATVSVLMIKMSNRIYIKEKKNYPMSILRGKLSGGGGGGGLNNFKKKY
jgi:hypothetical protein